MLLWQFWIPTDDNTFIEDWCTTTTTIGPYHKLMWSNIRLQGNKSKCSFILNACDDTCHLLYYYFSYHTHHATLQEPQSHDSIMATMTPPWCHHTMLEVDTRHQWCGFASFRNQNTSDIYNMIWTEDGRTGMVINSSVIGHLISLQIST